MDEWKEKVMAAKCPETWTYDSLGYSIRETGGALRFYPGMSNIDEINASKADFFYVNAILYSHGIQVWLSPDHKIFEHSDLFIYSITNEQIVDVDLVPYDEYVKYKKSLESYMSKGAAIAAVGNTGMIGVALGATIGAIASIGHKTSHLKGKYLRITFWDKKTKVMRYLLLDHPKQEYLEKFVEDWGNEKKINEETGRKPTNKGAGCFSVIALFVAGTILFSFV